jgi:thiol-disulfide isomerase/thioredoxin
MYKFHLIILLYFITILNGSGQVIEIIGIEDMEHIIHTENGKTKVINFWATWCKPCIEELSYFEAVNKNTDFKNFEVILISLDFVEDLDTRVKKFIERKDLRSSVKLLDNVDYNSWIDKVDPSWSGAIPATLVVNSNAGKRRFFEKQFEKGELEFVLKDFENELNQTNK